MELTIGICDDCMEQIKLLRRYLDKYDDQQFDVKIISSIDPEFFLSIVKDKKPGMVFLDIDMEGLDGIKLGEKIKKENEDIVIIYITAHEEYALDAFRIRAFHYLIKPLKEEKFSMVFKEAVGLLSNKAKSENRGVFNIQKKDEIISLYYDDILYFEKLHHKIKVHCTNRNIDFYGSFKVLIQDIDLKIFIRCHQGYIVNKNKIRGYRDKVLLLEDSIELPVSRAHIMNIKEMLTELLFPGDDNK